MDQRPISATFAESQKWSILHLYQPDIAILHRIAVILEQNGTGAAWVAAHAGRGVGDELLLVPFFTRQALLVVDQDAVVMDGHDGRADHFAVVAARGLEEDVVALPNRRRLAGVDERRSDAVDAAAVVVLAFQTVAVESLDFISPLQIDAAVASSLAGSFRHVRDAELDMKQEFAGEFLFGDDVAAAGDLHDAAREQF